MLLELLTQVSAQAKDKIKDASILESEKEDKLSKALADGLKFHVDHLGETIKKDEAELVNEEQEQKKHITSDDLHDGFSNKVCLSQTDSRLNLMLSSVRSSQARSIPCSHEKDRYAAKQDHG